MRANSLYLLGAGGRTRTGMSLRTEDFESSASTNFTTPADQRGRRPPDRSPLFMREAPCLSRKPPQMPGILLALAGAVLVRVRRGSRTPEPPPVERTPRS